MASGLFPLERMSDDRIEREDAAIAAIAIVKAACDDCADFCEHLSRKADAGMPALDAQSRMLAKIILAQVAEAFRAKGLAFERRLSSLAEVQLQ